MGIRLYPRTEDIRVLEILAGVPAGTSVSLKEFEQKPLSFFGTNEALATLARAIWADYQADDDVHPKRRAMTVADHFRELRSEYRRDAEFTRFQYRSHVLRRVDMLDSFLSEGWGRVEARGDHLKALHKGNEDYAGCANDVAQVRQLLEIQIDYRSYLNFWFDTQSWLGERGNVKLCTPAGSVFLSELKGLCWS